MSAEPCIPEWCEPMGVDEEHSDVCPNHPHEITKGEIVTIAENTAKHAIEAYLFMVGDGCTEAEAIDLAIDEAREGVTCCVGIGSCGRGWCQHN